MFGSLMTKVRESFSSSLNFNTATSVELTDEEYYDMVDNQKVFRYELGWISRAEADLYDEKEAYKKALYAQRHRTDELIQVNTNINIETINIDNSTHSHSSHTNNNIVQVEKPMSVSEYKRLRGY